MIVSRSAGIASWWGFTYPWTGLLDRSSHRLIIAIKKHTTHCDFLLLLWTTICRVILTGDWTVWTVTNDRDLVCLFVITSLEDQFL